MVDKLRFGIMCDDTFFPAWQARCIQTLMAIRGVSLQLLIMNPERPPSYSRGQQLWRLATGKVTFFRIYERLAAGGSVAEASVDLAEALAGVTRMQCRVHRRGGLPEYFSKEDLAAISGHDLDFILRFSYGIIRGAILKVPRYGVWSFHHDDPDSYRGTPPGFWEIFHRDPITETILQRLTSRLDGGVVLYKGYFPTIGRSWIENRGAAFMGAADWPARMCNQIMAGDTACFEADPVTTDAPIFLQPKNPEMLQALWVMFQNWLSDQYRSLFTTEQWNVGIVSRPVESFLGTAPDGAAATDVRWASQTKHADFISDPFGLPGDHGTVLVEEFDYRTQRGRISALPRTGDDFGQPRTVLECPEHLSYPYLLEDDGQVYCIPEIADARELRLYRLPGLPGDKGAWELDTVLLRDFAAVDPTIFRHEGRYWLLCTNADDQADAKLLGFHSPSLRGPWKAHALNPLKTDIRGSRPAGRPFVHEGKLYRPAQDCTDGYGSAVAIHHVQRLTPTEFYETRITTVRPDPNGPYPDGLHTLVSVGGGTIIDGRRNAFIPRVFQRNLTAKLRRLARAGE